MDDPTGRRAGSVQEQDVRDQGRGERRCGHVSAWFLLRAHV